MTKKFFEEELLVEQNKILFDAKKPHTIKKIQDRIHKLKEVIEAEFDLYPKEIWVEKIQIYVDNITGEEIKTTESARSLYGIQITIGGIPVDVHEVISLKRLNERLDEGKTICDHLTYPGEIKGLRIVCGWLDMFERGFEFRDDEFTLRGDQARRRAKDFVAYVENEMAKCGADLEGSYKRANEGV